MYYTLAIRNLTKRKLRTFLSALGIMIGVAMIISLVSVSQGLKRTTDEFASSIGGTIYVVAEGTFGPPSTSNLDISVIEDIEKIPGVQLAAPQILLIGTVEGYRSGGGIFGGGGGAAGLVGVDPDKERRLSSTYTKIVAGRFLKEDERGSAVIGRVLANAMNKRIGDSVTFSFEGEDYDYDVVGIYESESGGETSDNLVVPFAEVQSVGNLPNYRINAVQVLPTSPGQTELLERKIKLLINNADPSYARAFVSTLSTFTSTLQTVTWVIAGIAAFIGGVGILNTMIMSVMEQTKEIGVLKAVGWLNGDVMKLIVAESVGISVVGAAMGLAVGLFSTQIALPQVFKGALTPVLTWQIVLQAVGFAIFLGLVGGLIPARKAASLEPVEAFRVVD
ncbi:MAG: ABC transporter permease [archaeon]